MVDCKLVAVKDDNGVWLIAEDIMNESDVENVTNIDKKMGFSLSNIPEFLREKSTRLYAWVLSDVKKYQGPIPWKPKSGAVIWSSVNNDKLNSMEIQHHSVSIGFP